MLHRSLALFVLCSPALSQSFVPRDPLFTPTWVEVLQRADFDGDGFAEVFARDVAFTPNPVYVWEPDANGQWGSTRAEGVGFFPPPEIEDYDGDGFMDFAIVEEPLFAGTLAVYYGAPSGQPFTRIEASPVTTDYYNELAAPDYDGDGDADLVVMNGSQLLVTRNDGARQFSDLYLASEGYSGRSLTALDVDNDGLEDLVVEIAGGLGWRRSRGDGRFEPTQSLFGSAVTFSWELEAFDVDGDGDEDVVCREASAFGVGGGDRTSYWVQMGPGSSAVLRNDHLSSPGAAEKIGDVRDLDLDGVPDMVLVAYDYVAYRRGLGGGAFGPPSIFPNPNPPGFQERAAVVVDVDGDGDEDILRGWANWLENVDHPGTVICPGEPNAVGAGAALYAAGSELIASNRLTLNATQLPPGAFGLFFTSLQSAAPYQPPGTAGNICLGGAIGRFDRSGEIRSADAAGVLRLPLCMGDVPDAVQGSVAIVAPQARYFQLWYRDVAGTTSTSNFSAAIRVELR